MLTHQEIFREEVADCSPDARFLLEVMAMQWGRGDRSVHRWTVSSLSKLLHSPLKAVRKALLELVDRGLVQLSTESSFSRGRPAHEYALGEVIQKWFESNSVDYGHHQDRMAALFSGAGFSVGVVGSEAQVPKLQEPERGRKEFPVAPEGFLSIRNKLLLGTLLSGADRFGCVRDLPTKKLQQLTGMNSDRVKHRLGRLVSLGLIRTIVPGVSSPIFRSGRLASSFYLNLNHPGFGLAPANAIWMSFTGGDDRFGAFDRLEADLHDLRIQRERCVRAGRKDLLVYVWGRYSTPEAVLRYLLNERAPALLALRVSFYRHAAGLLDEFQAGKIVLSEQRQSKMVAALQAELSELDVDDPVEPEHLPPGLLAEATEAESEFATRKAAILEHFCSVIVLIANAYQDRLSTARLTLSDLGVCILPVSDSLGSVRDDSIAVLFDGALKGSYLCTRDDDIFWTEEDVPLNIRIRHGLVTEPKS